MVSIAHIPQIHTTKQWIIHIAPYLKKKEKEASTDVVQLNEYKKTPQKTTPLMNN